MTFLPIKGVDPLECSPIRLFPNRTWTGNLRTPTSAGRWPIGGAYAPCHPLYALPAPLSPLTSGHVPAAGVVRRGRSLSRTAAARKSSKASKEMGGPSAGFQAVVGKNAAVFNAVPVPEEEEEEGADYYWSDPEA